MDATCNVQDSIHVFHLVHNMCPGFWVHIITSRGFSYSFKNSSEFFKTSSRTEAYFFKDLSSSGWVIKVIT